MDVRKWKEYATRVQQYRLEYRMQHKIATYDGEQGDLLDPDLPPELAAALAVERRQMQVLSCGGGLQQPRRHQVHMYETSCFWCRARRVLQHAPSFVHSPWGQDLLRGLLCLLIIRTDFRWHRSHSVDSRKFPCRLVVPRCRLLCTRLLKAQHGKHLTRQALLCMHAVTKSSGAFCMRRIQCLLDARLLRTATQAVR